MKCTHCGTGFEAERCTAKYCSAKCRKAGQRAWHTDVSGTTDFVTVTPEVTVTLTQAQLDSLPAGVTKPGRGPDWSHTQDYANTIHRLLT